MRFIFLFIINIYQKIISPALKNILGIKSFCRFSPSCSSFAKQSIVDHGVIKGSYFAILRVISCQPFSFKKQSN